MGVESSNLTYGRVSANSAPSLVCASRRRQGRSVRDTYANKLLPAFGHQHKLGLTQFVRHSLTFSWTNSRYSSWTFGSLNLISMLCRNQNQGRGGRLKSSRITVLLEATASTDGWNKFHIPFAGLIDPMRTALSRGLGPGHDRDARQQPDLLLDGFRATQSSKEAT